MKTALISDIHGNAGGLRAALADSRRLSCDRVVCLGDTADGGPDSITFYAPDGPILVF